MNKKRVQEVKKKEKGACRFRGIKTSLDYFLGRRPNVDVTSSASGRPFLCPWRQSQRRGQNGSETRRGYRSRGLPARADAETMSPLMKRRCIMFIVSMWRGGQLSNLKLWNEKMDLIFFCLVPWRHFGAILEIWKIFQTSLKILSFVKSFIPPLWLLTWVIVWKI